MAIEIANSGNSIPRISQRQIAELQKKYQNGTWIDWEALRARAQDSVVIKGITQFTMLALPSENYNDINKQVTGLPASVFTDQFGYDMQNPSIAAWQIIMREKSARVMWKIILENAVLLCVFIGHKCVRQRVRMKKIISRL